MIRIILGVIFSISGVAGVFGNQWGYVLEKGEHIGSFAVIALIGGALLIWGILARRPRGRIINSGPVNIGNIRFGLYGGPGHPEEPHKRLLRSLSSR